MDDITIAPPARQLVLVWIHVDCFLKWYLLRGYRHFCRSTILSLETCFFPLKASCLRLDRLSVAWTHVVRAWSIMKPPCLIRKNSLFLLSTGGPEVTQRESGYPTWISWIGRWVSAYITIVIGTPMGPNYSQLGWNPMAVPIIWSLRHCTLVGGTNIFPPITYRNYPISLDIYIIYNVLYMYIYILCKYIRCIK